MGLFGRDININVNSDVVSNENLARAEIHVISRSTIRQQRKFEKDNYKRDLDKHYRELAFAQYDVNDPKQIVETMTQLAAFISARPFPGAYVKVQKEMLPYLNSAEANLHTGIDLLKAVDPSNPMIAHFEGFVTERAKNRDRQTAMRGATIFSIIMGILVLLLLLWDHIRF